MISQELQAVQKELVIPYIPRVQSNFEFLGEVLPRIKAAKYRVLLQSMDLSYDHPVILILNSMEDAAVRGVDVRLLISRYALNSSDDISTKIHRLRGADYHTEKHRELNDKLKTMRRLGVHQHLVTPKHPWWDPLGRFCENHMKGTVVDNTWWIHSLNFTGGSFRYEEMAIEINDPRIVERAYEIQRAVGEGWLVGSETTFCTPHYEILTDYKVKRGDSHIYNQGCDFVENESAIIQACAMLPYSGELLKRILDLASRKIKVEIIMSNPNETLLHTFPYNFLYARMLHKIEPYLNKYIFLYYAPSLIHIKMLLGSKAVLFGSHNFEQWLVDHIPPDEMQIASSDPYLLEQLRKKFEDLKAKSLLHISR